MPFTPSIDATFLMQMARLVLPSIKSNRERADNELARISHELVEVQEVDTEHSSLHQPLSDVTATHQQLMDQLQLGTVAHGLASELRKQAIALTLQAQVDALAIQSLALWREILSSRQQKTHIRNLVMSIDKDIHQMREEAQQLTATSHYLDLQNIEKVAFSLKQHVDFINEEAKQIRNKNKLICDRIIQSSPDKDTIDNERILKNAALQRDQHAAETRKYVLALRKWLGVNKAWGIADQKNPSVIKKYIEAKRQFADAMQQYAVTIERFDPMSQSLAHVLSPIPDQQGHYVTDPIVLDMGTDARIFLETQLKRLARSISQLIVQIVVILFCNKRMSDLQLEYIPPELVGCDLVQLPSFTSGDTIGLNIEQMILVILANVPETQIRSNRAIILYGDHLYYFNKDNNTVEKVNRALESDQYDALKNKILKIKPGMMKTVTKDKALALIQQVTGKSSIALPELIYAMDPITEPLSKGSPIKVQNLGHATQLIQTSGISILIDPVFGDLARVLYPSKTEKFGMDAKIKKELLSQLSAINVILISHNHRDHVDEGTLTLLVKTYREMGKKLPTVMVPPGDEDLFKQMGFVDVRVVHWNDPQVIGDVMFTGVPSQHRSGRGPFDLHQSSVMGWTIAPQDTNEVVYVSGDTARLSNARMEAVALNLYRAYKKQHGHLDGAFKLINIQPGGPNYTRKDMKPTHQSAVDGMASAFRLALSLAKISKQNGEPLTAADWLDKTATLFMHHMRYELGPDRFFENMYIHDTLMVYLDMSDAELKDERVHHDFQSKSSSLFGRDNTFILEGLDELKTLAAEVWPAPAETKPALKDFLTKRIHFPLIQQAITADKMLSATQQIRPEVQKKPDVPGHIVARIARQVEQENLSPRLSGHGPREV